MDVNNTAIQFYDKWLINNLLLSNTKSVSIPGYPSWLTIENLSSYSIAEPPRVYMHVLVSGDRWREAGAFGPDGMSVAYRISNGLLQVQGPGGAFTATLRYKIMTKGLG